MKNSIITLIVLMTVVNYNYSQIDPDVEATLKKRKEKLKRILQKTI